MLSNEEIEKHIKLVKLKEYEANSTEKALVEYIEQLETKLETVTTQRNKLATELSDKEDDKQKLIENLEEDIAEYRKEMQNTNIKLNQIHYMKRIEYAQEILKIVKGEKNE